MKTKLKTAIWEAVLESNHQKIQRIMQLSDFGHKELIFETGMRFLEELYGTGTSKVQMYSRCRPYWNWWLSEYNRWEFEYLYFYERHRPTICDETLQVEMDGLISDRITVEGFRNYLKLFYNVCI